MKYHLLAFVTGCVLDLILGDPYFLYHPVRLIGKIISTLENKWNRKEKEQDYRLKRGAYMVMLVLVMTIIVTTAIILGAYLIHPVLGTVVEAIMTYQILAMKCLKVESMKVYRALKDGTLEEARRAVSMIVGRDTEVLDETGVAKAAIETVAENTSDGVIAPMIYTAIGGPVLGFASKAINTMDSMVGYKNEKYMDFGRAAALLDDRVNYMPARISGILMIFGAYIIGIFDKHYKGKNAGAIFRRDRFNHASPNSAQTEAACAGALEIQLAGDAYYFGKKCSKPYIGEAYREIEYEDIKRANNLMYATSFVCAGICILAMILAMILGIIIVS